MNKIILLLFGLLLAGNLRARANYLVEDVSLPDDPDLNGQVDGLAFMPDGRLAACFPFGKVYTLDPKTEEWTLFAEGLHNPLGIVAVDDLTLIIAQRPEITRLFDNTFDGVADWYDAVCDDFGMSGNYHEFHFGPVRDKEGNLFSALGTASSGDGIRHEVRGDFYFNSPAYYNNPEIKPEPFDQMVGAFNKKRPGRMYSSVPYRGWVIKVTLQGEMIPWAFGLRTPNGLGFDLKGNLFCTDNQGDWLGSSKLYHIKQGRFYGHAASQPWREGFVGDPLATPVSTLDEMRSRACVVFPQGSMANSPTQPLVDSTRGKFGPFAGQLLVGEMNKPRIMRIMLEEVDGELQGACIPFIDGSGLSSGNNRLAFDCKGRLFVGHTKHTWAGASGLQRVTWNGEMPFDVKTMKLADRGFTLEFTEPVDAAIARNPETWQFKRYYYSYHEAYGSPQKDVTSLRITTVRVSDDGLRVDLEFDGLKAWHLYELSIAGLTSKARRSLKNNFMVYTLNRFHKNTPPPPVEQQGSSSADKRKPVKAWGFVEPSSVKTGKPRKNPEPGVFEAEMGTVKGARQRASNAGWYGKGYVDFGKGANESITWSVKASDAGPHTLKFRYALAGGARPLQLLVNGEPVGKPLPFKDSGGWTKWGFETTNVTLQAGRNSISLRSVGKSGPNIDSVQVTPVP